MASFYCHNAHVTNYGIHSTYIAIYVPEKYDVAKQISVLQKFAAGLYLSKYCSLYLGIIHNNIK